MYFQDIANIFFNDRYLPLITNIARTDTQINSEIAVVIAAPVAPYWGINQKFKPKFTNAAAPVANVKYFSLPIAINNWLPKTSLKPDKTNLIDIIYNNVGTSTYPSPKNQ